MSEQKHVVRGVIAGVLGGLVASWVMNEFTTGPGKKLTQAVQSDAENEQDAAQHHLQQASGQEQDDATMKTADALVHTATGAHLSEADKKEGGPAVHYAFGAVMGGVYGGLAEYSALVRSGFGTTFATALFTGADLFAVPAAGLAPSPAEQPAAKLMTPYASHLVYGVTTELVRRLVRWVL